MFDSNSLWCKVVHTIDGIGPNNWHTSWKFGKSLKSPWFSISKIWLQYESIVTFRLIMEEEFGFGWIIGLLILLLKYPFLGCLTSSFPKGLIFDHWDDTSCSWNIILWRLLKVDEIIDFQQLLGVSARRIVNDNLNSRSWSLDSSREVSVKSLRKHLAASSPYLLKWFSQLCGSPKLPKKIMFLFG